jgi:hypothetical protein
MEIRATYLPFFNRDTEGFLRSAVITCKFRNTAQPKAFAAQNQMLSNLL